MSAKSGEAQVVEAVENAVKNSFGPLKSSIEAMSEPENFAQASVPKLDQVLTRLKSGRLFAWPTIGTYKEPIHVVTARLDSLRQASDEIFAPGATKLEKLAEWQRAALHAAVAAESSREPQLFQAAAEEIETVLHSKFKSGLLGLREGTIAEFARRAVPELVEKLEALSPKKGVTTALVIGFLTAAYLTSTGSANITEAQTPG